jgi:hypothetical protein
MVLDLDDMHLFVTTLPTGVDPASLSTNSGAAH